MAKRKDNASTQSARKFSVFEKAGVWNGVSGQEMMRLKNMQEPGFQGEDYLLQGVGIFFLTCDRKLLRGLEEGGDII